MPSIYRKTLKGIDEAAFNTTGLPVRLLSYLLAVDGQTSVSELSGRNPHLPSMSIVLDGLREQGFLELLSAQVAAQNVVPMRVSNGVSTTARSAMPPLVADTAPYTNAPMAAPVVRAPYAPAAPPVPDMEPIKASMISDVTQLLGKDAQVIIAKIQNCKSKADLLAIMLGVKDIVALYSNAQTAEKFMSRYQMVMI